VADLELDTGLVLRRIGWRGLAQDFGEAFGVAEFGEPAAAFGLPAGNQVVQLARCDLGDGRANSRAWPCRWPRPGLR
jgi:hypothetical protein